MTELARRSVGVSEDEICQVLRRDGAMVLEGVLSPKGVAQALDELMPYVEATRPGRDQFAGVLTTRTGGLVGRSAVGREMILHEAVLPAARRFLSAYCERIQLHLAQVIRILPGQPAQLIHRDRWAWGTHLDRLEPQFNSIWALSPFRKENGATQVVPASVDWPDARQPKDHEIQYAEMDPGSVLLYSGAVFHGGGSNLTENDRIGVNITYTLGWLRQEENQYLSCPPDIARELPHELQDLIGYAQGNYALGYFTPPGPPGAGPELVGPEYALGRGGEESSLGTDELREALAAQVIGTGAPGRPRS
jgi:hypothetical protein